MWRCRKCKQEVSEENMVEGINVRGSRMWYHECGGIVDYFANAPQEKAVSGTSDILCECGSRTWVRSQKGVITCLYCKRSPRSKIDK